MHEPVSGKLVYPKFLAAVQRPVDAGRRGGLFLSSAAVRRRSTRWSRWTTLSTSGRRAAATPISSTNTPIKKILLERTTTGACPTTSTSARSTIARTCWRRRASSRRQTWDEFQAAAIALNDPANGVFGVVYPAGDFHIAQHFYMSFMFQAGGGILDKDGKLIFGTTAQGRQRQGAHLPHRLRHQAQGHAGRDRVLQHRRCRTRSSCRAAPPSALARAG